MASSIQTVLRVGNVRLRTKKDGSLTSEQDFHFRILADSLTQDRNDILLNTPGTPKFGVVYGSYGMLLKGCDAQRLEDNPLLWDCVFNLSNQVEEGEDKNPADGSPQIGDPTAWVPVVELGYEDYEEVMQKALVIDNSEKHPDIGGSDADGYSRRTWMNSANDLLETGFVRQQRIITRKFTQFEKISGVGAVTLDDIEARNDTLNNAVYLGRPKRTLKLSVDSVAAGFYYGLRCWRVDYVIAYKATDWRLKKLDVGWSYIAFDGEKYPFLDKDESNFLGGLNGTGGPSGGYATGDPRSGLSDQDNTAILFYKEFPSVDFSSFLLLA